MGIFASIQKAVLTPITGAGNLITAGIEKITGVTAGRTTAEEAQKTVVGKVLSTAIAGTGLALGVAVAAPAVTGAIVSGAAKQAVIKVGTKAITHPIKTAKAILGTTAFAGLIAGGGLELIKPVLETTYKAGKITGEIATGDKKLSSENVKDALKTAGIITGVATFGAITGIVAEKIINNKDKVQEKVQEKVKKTEEKATTPIPNTVIPEEKATTPTQKTISTDEGEPLAPEYTTISTSKKRKKRAKKKDLPYIRNNVQVVVQNRNVGLEMRKFIKEYVYA